MPRLAFAALASALGAALLGGSGAAHAQRPDAVFDPLTMDPHTPASKLDVDFAYISYDEPEGVDLSVIGFALSGQYVTPRGLGGYLSLPLSFIAYDAPTELLDDSALALGNLELGGLWAKYVRPRTAIAVHLGVALPTASDEGAAGLQFLATLPRFGDFVQRVTSSTWLRFGISPMGRSGQAFWRVDLGVDLALEEDNLVDISPVFRFNIGGGLDLRSAHLLAELVTNIVDDGSEDEVNSTLSFGVRFLSGNLRPGLALILPLKFEDGDYEPELALALSLAAHL